MLIYINKYNIFENDTSAPLDVRHAQVACLYWRFHKSVEEIALITGYAKSTVKNYISKYQELEEMYDAYFNADAPKAEKYVRTPLPIFTDGYNAHPVESDSGLYLIGSTYFDPKHPDRLYYWIKVGLSSNLEKRIKGYRSHNPMVWVADTITFDVMEMGQMEQYCHIMLSDIAYGIARDTEEWFIVTAEQYNEICSKGFSYFFG